MFSTGIKGLDQILNGLRAGDNVVWQIDDIDDYLDFVGPFVKKAVADGKNVIYMRFASHKSLVKAAKNVKVYELDASGGFESFATLVNNIITKEGRGAYYVFDCLSDLLQKWATDLMIGNFFVVTCPYLFELDTIAYFSIMRNNHSYKTVARIRETTQLLLDLHHFEKNFYLHPLKVWNRYSPTMFMPHLMSGEELLPITDSVNASRLLSYISKKSNERVMGYLDYWDHLFMEAQTMARKSISSEKCRKMIKDLCRLMLSRDGKLLSLLADRLSLKDLVEIRSRLIGTGLIGGKSVGMILARKILSAEKGLDWQSFSEPHDSFYIGSDVYYTYIVQNGWWKLRMQQKTQAGYFDAARLLKEKMLHGKFPEEIMEQFQRVIEYFGTSPIIVRSSSILEDGFGNAFAGKYESVFLANQGTPEQRYVEFAEAVRRIYASTMGEDALVYRKQRGLDTLDEQMALLVQRVSGSYHGDYFFPDIGGVGISYNTYVWTGDIEPEAGMLRMVFGLGTRAVNRVEGDYPRIAALDAPLMKPHADMEDLVRFSQHEVDLIDVRANALKTVPFLKVLGEDMKGDPAGIVSKDPESGQRVITFDRLLSGGTFTAFIRKVLKTLEKNYDYPVEVEFTVNFTGDGEFRLNVLQCRPLQTKGLGRKVEMPSGIKKDEILFLSEGYFLGGNVSLAVKRVIYVDPAAYIALDLSAKYDVARAVGKLNKMIRSKEEEGVLLLGPGRWGTSTPSLGVSVTFSEINNIGVMGELAFPGGNLMPELSYGTHFFQDLVETGIFYLALFPGTKGVVFNLEKLDSSEEIFRELLPDMEKYAGVIKVYDVAGEGYKIMSDVLSRKVICFGGRSE